MTNKISWTSFELIKDHEVFKEDPEEGEEAGFGKFYIEQPKVYNTLIGSIDVDNPYNILSNFNLWIMDTKFKITYEIIGIINQIDGVEIIKPITQYKLVIGFGALFDTATVKVAIENKLTGKHKNFLLINEIPDEETRNNANQLYNKISKYAYWYMYIFPNGNIEDYCTSDEKDYKKKLKEITEVSKLSNGILIRGN